MIAAMGKVEPVDSGVPSSGTFFQSPWAVRASMGLPGKYLKTQGRGKQAVGMHRVNLDYKLSARRLPPSMIISNIIRRALQYRPNSSAL